MIGQEPTNTNPLQKLRAALHAKAKSAPNFRFYSLYDKVYRQDVLQAAWEQCRANGGAPGVDGQTFEDIEQYGAQRWLDELTEELRTIVNYADDFVILGRHRAEDALAAMRDMMRG